MRFGGSLTSESAIRDVARFMLTYALAYIGYYTISRLNCKLFF